MDGQFVTTGRVLAGYGVVEMIARVFGIALLGALISASGAFAQDETPRLNLAEGAEISVRVPVGDARTVRVEFSNVQDRNGRIASFRLRALQDGRIVGNQRVTVIEPGGIVTREFPRPFDRGRRRSQTRVVNLCS